MNLSTIEQLAFSTVRIQGTLSDGYVSTGTGFFYAITLEGKHIPLIITNKHVVEDAETGTLRFTLKNEKDEPDYGNNFDLQITDFEKAWTMHPDPDIDLCAMPIAEVQNLIVEKTGKDPFYKYFTSEIIPNAADIEELIGMEEVKMIGYPNGLWDEVNNLPLYRNGVLTSNYRFDWNGEAEFIVDLSVFPGSSGSPIFLLDETGYKTRNSTILGKTRFKLLGIVYAVFQSTVEGDIKTVKIPTKKKDIAVSLIPNNLGIAIKSHILLDLENIFKARINPR